MLYSKNLLITCFHLQNILFPEMKKSFWEGKAQKTHNKKKAELNSISATTNHKPAFFTMYQYNADYENQNINYGRDF